MRRKYLIIALAALTFTVGAGAEQLRIENEQDRMDQQILPNAESKKIISTGCSTMRGSGC